MARLDFPAGAHEPEVPGAPGAETSPGGRLSVKRLTLTDFRCYHYQRLEVDESPVVPANPETIYDVLRDLMGCRREWPNLGRRSRAFAEKRHSFAAAVEMYEAIYDRIWWGKEIDLIRFHDPPFEPGRGKGTDDERRAS